MPGNMKMSLLEMTQDILSALNSDMVNSISDTPESLQVAQCIKNTYFNMLGRYDMPEHNQLFNLNASNDTTKPVLMYRPDGVTRIEWIDYFDTNPADGAVIQTSQTGAYSHDLNIDVVTGSFTTTSTTTNSIGLGQVTFTVPSGLSITNGMPLFAIPVLATNSYMFGTVTSYSGTTLIIQVTSASGSGSYSNWTINQNGPSNLLIPGYRGVEILSIRDFLDLTSAYGPIMSDVQSFTLTIPENTTGSPSTFTFYYKNDKQPEWCCIISNYYVVFDSYDNTQDSTLQSSKTRAFGWVYPTFQMTDTFVPVLDAQQFPLLLNDAKSLAFYEIKNQPHQKAEEEVARQVVSLQKWKAIADKPSYFDELPNYGRRGGGWW